MLRKRHFGAPLVTAVALCFSSPLSHAVDNNWIGTTSSDWNDGTNWSEGGVPDTLFGDNVVVSTVAPNIATITVDISSTPNDIVVTGGGRIDHRAGIAGTNGGSWMFVGMDSTPSFYNLADTSTVGTGISGYGQGTGTLNATGNLNLAAWGGNRNGTMNINTTGALNVTGTLRIGNDDGSIGVMNLESGSVILSHTGWGADETHIGHGGGVATLNIAAGSLSASRNFRLGNDRGNGTINITGGSLTVAGTDDVFIGRDKGTGVITQSGGVVEFNHNTYIGNGNNAGSNTDGTYNLSAGVLNVKREFAIGREGANATHTGTLNMTGGTITKTGDERMIVGHNNGKGFVVHSGGTINVNQNQLYIGNENAGAQGTYTLSGAGALNVADELVVGREGGTGTLNVNGGALTTSGNGNMYVGRRNGTGTLNQTGGAISVNREFGVGTRDDNKIGTGTYNLNGGTLSAANNIFVGKELGSSGTMIMTGGSMTGGDKLIIGDNGATGALSQSSGTVNVPNEIFVGNGLPQSQSILANAYDGQLGKSLDSPETVTGPDNGNWNVNVGESWGGLTTAVIPFQLPDFGAVANPFTSASFGVNLYNKGGATVTDLDLYAVRVSSSPQIATTDWYNGSEPDPNATLIQASFLTPTSTTTSIGAQSGPNNFTDGAGSAALLAYLNSAYDGGAGASKFVFLRVSYGSDTFPAGWDAYNFTTRNADLKDDAPVINFTSTTPGIGPDVSAPDGTYNLSGDGVIDVGNEVIVGRENGKGTFNLNGGTVNTNKIVGGTGTATVNFNGGVLAAKRDEANLIENLDVADAQSGGLKINSNGFNVGTSQVLSGTGGLEKSGAGQLTLSGANTYAGTTTVTEGALRVEKTGLNAIVDAAANTLVVEFTVQPTVGDYSILSGPLAGAQTFSATGLGANQQATFDNQTSTVTVTETQGNPFATWIDGYTPSDLLPDEASKLPGADPDSDGITNLVEFVLGGSPVVPSQEILPTLATVGADLVLSYTRSDDSESVTTQVGQWSTDLTNWSNVTPVLVNENDASADDMTITVPKSNAVNGKLFLRLSVETNAP